MRAKVKAEANLTASAGIATNKVQYIVSLLALGLLIRVRIDAGEGASPSRG